MLLVSKQEQQRCDLLYKIHIYPFTEREMEFGVRTAEFESYISDQSICALVSHLTFVRLIFFSSLDLHSSNDTYFTIRVMVNIIYNV